MILEKETKARKQEKVRRERTRKRRRRKIEASRGKINEKFIASKMTVSEKKMKKSREDGKNPVMVFFLNYKSINHPIQFSGYHVICTYLKFTYFKFNPVSNRRYMKNKNYT